MIFTLKEIIVILISAIISACLVFNVRPWVKEDKPDTKYAVTKSFVTVIFVAFLYAIIMALLNYDSRMAYLENVYQYFLVYDSIIISFWNWFYNLSWYWEAIIVIMLIPIIRPIVYILGFMVGIVAFVLAISISGIKYFLKYIWNLVK